MGVKAWIARGCLDAWDAAARSRWTSARFWKASSQPRTPLGRESCESAICIGLPATGARSGRYHGLHGIEHPSIPPGIGQSCCVSELGLPIIYRHRSPESIESSSNPAHSRPCQVLCLFYDNMNVGPSLHNGDHVFFTLYATCKLRFLQLQVQVFHHLYCCRHTVPVA